MSTPFDAAREQARQGNGQFGTQAKAESPVRLVTPSATEELPDGDGVGYLVDPGVIDGGSRAVYCSGAQSLALARQLHERTGWPVIVTTRIGPDPELDESEWEGADHLTELYEAHIEHPDGFLVTINGREDTYPSSGSDFVDAWEYRRERVTGLDALDTFEDYCAQFPEEGIASTFVDPVLKQAGLAGARKSLTAGPSTNPKAEPFGLATTLADLSDHYESLTSPENISWDGMRSHADVQSEYRRLQVAYWVRRDEIDPARDRAWCVACRAEVDGADGEPTKHQTSGGTDCWVGR